MNSVRKSQAGVSQVELALLLFALSVACVPALQYLGRATESSFLSARLEEEPPVAESLLNNSLLGGNPGEGQFSTPSATLGGGTVGGTSHCSETNSCATQIFSPGRGPGHDNSIVKSG
ncbi:MAG: hypothetical protein KDD64_16655 [Bdellovibrionales bacterium]|nr:hypothetical protein [Bdellovibrionales bacterium]